MSDEATPVEAGNGATPESGPSIADIVGAAWPSDTTEVATPATPSAKAETGKGDSANESGDAAASSKPTYYTSEELRKLNVEDPSFDWSKVHPDVEPLLKAGQAALTRNRQALAEQRRLLAQERNQKPSQPTPEAAAEPGDPQTEENRKIVEGVLKELGLDPKVVGPVIEDSIYTAGCQLAAQTTPRYATDEAFRNAVHTALAADDRLAAMAESKSPEQIAYALTAAATSVERRELADRLATYEKREADIKKMEADLKTQAAEIEKQRTKMNRQSPSVAAGTQQGGAPPKAGQTTADVVDEIWPSGQAKLRV
jgi:hypothetical protein